MPHILCHFYYQPKTNIFNLQSHCQTEPVLSTGPIYHFNYLLITNSNTVAWHSSQNCMFFLPQTTSPTPAHCNFTCKHNYSCTAQQTELHMHVWPPMLKCYIYDATITISITIGRKQSHSICLNCQNFSPPLKYTTATTC